MKIELDLAYVLCLILLFVFWYLHYNVLFYIFATICLIPWVCLLLAIIFGIIYMSYKE